MSGSSRILVADHNQPIIEVVSWCLGENGYDIRIAASSDDAIEIALKFKPALLIIDPIMPRTTGIEAARRIFDATKCKVLFLSAAVGEGWLDQGVQDLKLLGCDCHAFGRPFEQKELLEYIETRIGLGPSASIVHQTEREYFDDLSTLDTEIAKWRGLLNRVSNVEARNEVTQKFGAAVDRRVRIGLSGKLDFSSPTSIDQKCVDSLSHDLRQLSKPQLLADSDYKVGLDDGDRMAWLLEPIVLASVAHLDQSSVSSKLRLESMTFLGLRTHCICFRGPYRFRCDDIASLQKLYTDWLLEALTAPSRIRGYHKAANWTPRTIFDLVHSREIAPVEKGLGLGPWQRFRNRTKFSRAFDEGILLGIMYDTSAKERFMPDSLQSSAVPSA